MNDRGILNIFEQCWCGAMRCIPKVPKRLKEGSRRVNKDVKIGQHMVQRDLKRDRTWAQMRALFAAESLTYHSAACCSSLAWTRKSELQTITYVLWACSNHIEVTYVVLFQFKEVSSKRGCEETRLRMCSQFHRKGKAMPKWSREAAVPCQRSMSFHVINHDITHSITNPYYCNPY